MSHNVGTIDRAFRAVAGLAALVWAFSIGLTGVAGILLALVGVVLLVTAAIGFCPLYRLLGISTARTEGAQRVTTPTT